MEYVVVNFDQSREVLMDDQPIGLTNESLRVGAGNHTFSLAGAPDFKPSQITQLIDNSSVLDPVVIQFEVNND